MKIISNFPEENKDERGITDYIPVIAFTIACFLAMLALVWRVCQIPIEYEGLIGELIKETIEETPEEPVEETIEEPIEESQVIEESFEYLAEEPIEIRNDILTVYDDYLMAQVVMHEAGNQEMIGKVAVVATILNRCDYFGLTVEQVVSSPNQYAYPYLGEISDEAYRAVEIARANRDLFPSTMMWFLPSGFPEYGEPYLKIQDHYFSYAVEEEG